MTWFYFSFADPDKPKGTKWLGALIIEADDFKVALTKSHLLGLNPGGEVVCQEIEHLPPDRFRYRLLDRATLREIGEVMGNTRAHNANGDEFEL